MNIPPKAAPERVSQEFVPDSYRVEKKRSPEICRAGRHRMRRISGMAPAIIVTFISLATPPFP